MIQKIKNSPHSIAISKIFGGSMPPDPPRSSGPMGLRYIAFGHVFKCYGRNLACNACCIELNGLVEMFVPGLTHWGFRSKDENQQQTQPTYDAESGNRTRSTLVGGLHGRQMLNHCAIPAPQCI